MASDNPIPVTVGNFTRAETDNYFANLVTDGGLGKLRHQRDMADIDHQTIVRMNRDTLYSSGVFDLDAGPVTITLPDTGARFLSLLAINEDHYVVDVAYGPNRQVYDKARVGTRYVALLIRTLADPGDPADLKAAHDAQDAIKAEQAGTGKFEAPNWETQSLTKVRKALANLGASLGTHPGVMFGSKSEVDPVVHLIGTAVGWGGNPPNAAAYSGVEPKANDGKTVHRLTVKDVPVDGFWSISVYNEKGFFEKNAQGVYSLNNLTAKKDADGGVTIQFGGCGAGVPNCLPIPPGWNYTVRMYRPKTEILSGKWHFPEATPVS